jgi:hypothetical protein
LLLLERRARHEPAGEDLPEHRFLRSPADLDQALEGGRAVEDLRDAPGGSTTRVGAEQHEVRDALRMPRRIGHRHGAALRRAEQGEALEARRRPRPPRGRFTHASNEMSAGSASERPTPRWSKRTRRKALRQLGRAWAATRGFGVVLEVRDPLLRAQERGAAAGKGVRDARAVGALAETDFLFHAGSPRPTRRRAASPR